MNSGILPVLDGDLHRSFHGRSPAHGEGNLVDLLRRQLAQLSGQGEARRGVEALVHVADPLGMLADRAVELDVGET
jgi:hypothetical protein